MLVVAVVITRFRNTGEDRGSNDRTRTSAGRNRSVTDQNRDRGFDRRASYLEYTRHARCRMDCRSISQSEVEYIMRNGNINYRKSNVNGRPCPVYAVEGITADDQRVRIVFAQCNEVTKVVTCIDLEREWKCACPGDDEKYNNKQR